MDTGSRPNGRTRRAARLGRSLQARSRLALLGAVALALALGGIAEAGKKNKVKAKVAEASDTFPSAQANNNGPALHSDPVTARCPRKKRAVGAGAKWSFSNPATPDVTPAHIQNLELRKKAMAGRGGSDTDATSSTFTAQAVCLKKKGLKIKTKSGSDSINASQLNNNSSTHPVGPVKVSCGKRGRALGTGWSWEFTNPSNPAVTPAQADSIDVGKKKVRAVGQSDTDADVQEFNLQVACLKKAPKSGLKVKIRTASSTFDVGGANNFAGVFISPETTAKCRKKERAVGAGADWDHTNPVNPQVTHAEIGSLDILKKKVVGIGNSDVDGDTSTFTVQAICVKKKK